MKREREKLNINFVPLPPNYLAKKFLAFDYVLF